MSKHLRIWLFVLLGTLITSTSLPAEGVITMTTSKAVGETINLGIKANGNVTIEGVKETPQLGEYAKSYTLTSQTITIRGDVTTLYCGENQLTSLDLSGCTALATFECYNNQLTSLDVSGCTSLTSLTCYENQLTSLNVSGCTALTYLWCSKNQLTSLDVSDCVALTKLKCWVNQLTSLDVSDCTALTTLFCYHNQLTSLDVSGCSALVWLSCSSNPLTSLDASGCTALTTLYCSWTQLTSLNVLGCTALTELCCEGSQLTNLDVSGCTALTGLQCYKNQLISLNVSGCTALTNLLCYENQLTSLDVSDCTALTGLYCYENQLTSLDVSGCTALTKLYCRINQLTSLDVSGCTSLTTLECYENQLTNLNVSGCSALTTLNCLNNQLTSLDLSNHARLRVLDCSNNLLRKIDLSGCTNIYLLICHKNQVKAPEMTSLVNSLPDLQGKGVGFFRVFYDGSGEGNVCFATHVAIAKAKNWKILFTRDPYDNYWHDYTGADNPIFTVTSSSTSGGAISFTGADNLNAVPYGTTLTVIATPAEGYELTELTANDRNILDTKQVVVSEDLLIKAIFRKKTFAVALSSNEHGTISIAESVDLDAVPYGTTLTVKATGKNAQCELTALTANGEDILETKSFVVKGATEVKATFVDHTGVETTVTQQVKLYPNPATDYVIVEGVAPASEVTLHSMTGERLYADRADSRGVLRIDLTPYADGVYLVCVAGETYRVVVRR